MLAMGVEKKGKTVSLVFSCTRLMATAGMRSKVSCACVMPGVCLKELLAEQGQSVGLIYEVWLRSSIGWLGAGS